MRDIDQIIAHVQQQIPEIIVPQFHRKFESDDDGIWWFTLPGENQDIQLESPSGSCPFLVETDEQSSHQARRAETVEEAVDMIISYLRPLRHISPPFPREVAHQND